MTNKTAIITGAGSGIGRSSALALSSAGFNVCLAGRRKPMLEETAESIANSERSLVVPTDVTDEKSVTNLFNTAKNEFGRVDVIFNNAGINIPNTSLEDLSYEHWKQVLDINLSGSFLCIREAFKTMKAQDPMGGRIINNGSLSAYMPRPDAIAYNASKHGVTGLTRSAALDGRKYNIACGQIDIGNASTDMTGKMQVGVSQADGSVATEPTMNVKHVADAVVYMAQLPLEANVLFMTVKATVMPYEGRG